MIAVMRFTHCPKWTMSIMDLMLRGVFNRKLFTGEMSEVDKLQIVENETLLWITVNKESKTARWS